ncbi:MAG: glypican [Cyanobacteriota bacterium]|nr:glypican [Cyanobacteriota bacterium]
MRHIAPRLRPVGFSLVLLSAAVGAPIVLGVALLMVIPLAVSFGLVAIWIVAAVLIAWAGIEGMAALERWMENDPRFHQ